MKPISKDYYFVDFHATIDAIKYRLYMLQEKVKELYKPTTEKKDYFCPRCKAQWTQLEVLDKVGPMGFECHRCDALLEREERQEGEASGNEMQAKLNNQLKQFLQMLHQIDLEDIPKNDFDTAMSLQVPVHRESNVNPLKPYQPTNAKGAAATANRVFTSTNALDVSVTTSSERSAAEQAAEAKRKADIAAQNVLPVWHTTSTVTGQPTGAAPQPNEAQANGASFVKEEEDVKDRDDQENDPLAAYYAQLEQEKENEAREDEEADDSLGDEDEFEDVKVEPPSTQTPPSSKPALTNGTKDVKKEMDGKGSETEGSTPATNASTPAYGAADGPALKRVKFEETAIANGNGKEDSDEDEGVDFEDV